MKPIPWNGLQITQAGIYSGVPIETYHGPLCGEGVENFSVSKSILWEMAAPEGSPAHLWAASYLNPDREPWEESEALILGRGAHHLLLGEAAFADQFVIRPETYPKGANYPDGFGTQMPWSGNALWCKAWLDDAKRQHLTVLKADHIKRIRGMSRTLAEHPMVRAGILNGLVEHTLVYRDVETGIWIKVRPDVVPTDDLDVSDLKTAASVSDRAVDRAIGAFGYFFQGGLIRMAFRNVLGAEVTSFSLVFVESQEPHCVRVVTVKDEDLELGENLARATLRYLRKCLDAGVFPGPGGHQSDAVWAGMPPYARQEIEYRMAQMSNEAETL